MSAGEGLCRAMSRALAPSANLTHGAGEMLGAMGCVARTRPHDIARLRMREGQIAEPGLLEGLEAGIIKMFRVRGWFILDRPAIPATETLRRFCFQVLWEYLDGLCKACAGHRYRTTASGVHEACVRCNTVGIAPHSDASRARALGMTRSGLSRLWSDRFDTVLSALADRDRETLRQVGKKRG